MLWLNYMPAKQSHKEVFAIKMFFCVSWQGKHAIVVKFSFQVFVILIFLETLSFRTWMMIWICIVARNM